jgi:serine/threonine protein kinase
MTSCPTIADLKRFLTGAPGGGEIEDHIKNCAGCRAGLDALLAAAGPAGRTLPYLSNGAADGPPPAEGADGPGRITGHSSGSMSARPPAQDGRKADTVPGYEILEELGRGGMGVVYKARQVALNRLVALKVILAGAHAGDEDLLRFRAEAHAVAQLQHPNIVQIFEVGEGEGLPFFSLELCSGGSLAERLDGTPLRPHDAAALVETLARAVAHAHAAGVVHRDLKPANILLQAIQHKDIKDTRDTREVEKGQPKGQPAFGPSGPWGPLCLGGESFSPKITDFGLAKRLDEQRAHADAGPTRTGAVMGTPSYMAPEQARGDAKRVGPAADVYALGAILYECLTGRPPFRAATTMDTLMQVLADEPVPPRRLQPQCPRDLETICLKCLHKEPARRYPSAEALANDLRRFLDGRPIGARPVGPLSRLGRWCLRNKALAAALGLAALGLVAAVVVLAVFVAYQEQANQQLRDEQARTREEQGHTREEATRKDAALRDARHQSARQMFERGLALCEQDEEARGLHWMARALRELPADDPDLEEAIRYNLAHWEPRLHSVRAAFRHTGAVAAVAFTPDGKTVLACGGILRSVARLYSADTGQPAGPPLQVPFVTFTAVAVSPDGKLLLLGGMNGSVSVWTAAGQPVGPPLPHRGQVTALAFSPDGKTFAVGSSARGGGFGEGTVTVRSVEDRSVRASWQAPGAVTAVDFVGNEVLTDGPVGLLFWAADTGRATRALSFGSIRAAGLSPDREEVAVVTSLGDVRVAQLTNGLHRSVPITHPGKINRILFSPDGRLILTAGADATARLWDARTYLPVGPPLRHPGQNRQQPWAMALRAGLHYRAGRYAEAAAEARTHLERYPKWEASVVVWLWLALAEHRLQHADEAAKWLAKATAWLDGHADGKPTAAGSLHLHDWLEAHALRREAERLIGKPPAEKPD